MTSPTWSMAPFVHSVVQVNGRTGNHYGKQKRALSFLSVV